MDRQTQQTAVAVEERTAPQTWLKAAQERSCARYMACLRNALPGCVCLASCQPPRRRPERQRR